MPLMQEGTEAAFWHNVEKLEEELKQANPKRSAKKVRSMAIAAAADIARRHGGDPDKWLNS